LEQEIKKKISPLKTLVRVPKENQMITNRCAKIYYGFDFFDKNWFFKF
jgi:hypothetical protein